MSTILEVTPKEDRSSRTAAYREVQGIIAEFTGSKLHAHEAEIIAYAAEDLLLASNREDPTALAAESAFETLMGTLEVERWTVGSVEQPTASTRLRRALAACAPSA
jgi:hypothetical protein